MAEVHVPDYYEFGKLKVWPWTIAGIESTVTVQGEKFKIAFDMGYASLPSLACSHVFISHGHIDHVAGIVHHASKRALQRTNAVTTYYTPPHLVNSVQQLFRPTTSHYFDEISLSKEGEIIGLRVYSELDGDENRFGNFTVKGIQPGEQVTLSKGVFVKAFATVHRVPSQGYIVYEKHRTLRPQYRGLDSARIRELLGGGEEVHEERVIPTVAYTGDTTIEVFKNVPDPDLLRVKLLITETTYVKRSKDKTDTKAVEKAGARGHIHLQEIVDNARAFDNVENILLVHLSDAVGVDFAHFMLKTLIKDVEPDLYEKVKLGVQLKQLHEQFRENDSNVIGEVTV